MSCVKFDELLKHAREDLSREEQLQLAQALAQHVSAKRSRETNTLFDALQARGVIGSIIDAPADLGTNPKYLEGFGENGR